MKVAMTYEEGLVFPHFGRTPAFKVYDIVDGTIRSQEVVDTNGTGHGALAGFLREVGAEVLICGGIGGGAVSAMNDAGIRIYAGASGKAEDVIATYIAGELPEVGEANCNHHDHEHHGDHDCAHGSGCHH